MEDLERECEDALFALCDVRERFPQRCADELQKCIRLKKEINMMTVIPKPALSDTVLITEEEKAIVDSYTPVNFSLENYEQKLCKLKDDLENLKGAMAQISKEKSYDINKLLKD